MKIKFNSFWPKVTPARDIANVEMPNHNYKNGHFNYVYDNTNDFVRNILDQAPIQKNHKNILVDIKVQNLTPQKHSCIPGWHLDGPSNPLHNSNPEVHHLFVLGDAPCSTEFITEEIELDISEKQTQKEILSLIPEKVSFGKVLQGVFNTFTRFDFHRGVLVEYPVERLLIRITETDIILPTFKPLTKLYSDG